MQVLSLIEKHKLHFNFTIGEELGAGADGQCFNLSDDKVIKLSVLFQNNLNINKRYENISKILDFVINFEPKAYAHVHEYGYIGSSYRHFEGAPKNLQKFIVYYYIMDKLYKISDDERRVFHSIVSHADTGKKKDLPLFKVKSILNGMKKGFDFDYNKVIEFVDLIKQSPIHHNDIHERNIMKDGFGNFKLIDLDRSIMR